MKNLILSVILSICTIAANAQFPPPVGQPGTTAIYKDSSVFVAWANGCTIVRGYQNISNPALGYASYGDSTMALGKAGENGLVSLGDGGYAMLTFANPIKNGAGWDFAVFENSFSDTFLELAFVEVSSDGINYFRFLATSNTQDTVQIDGFGIVDATKINNLAGKYRALYGTPFDLQELAGQSGLDINNITHIKIIDVVGCIQNAYSRYDQYGHKINDPWNTPFASSGFDLDAVGVINQVTGINELFAAKAKLSVFPNPVKDKAVIQFFLDKSSDVIIEIIDMTGKSVYMEKKSNHIQGWQTVEISGINANNGLYFLKVETQNGIAVQKIIISNE